MNKKNKNNIKTKFSNAFGVLGYLFCFLQWLWIVLLYFSLIMNMARFMSPDSSSSDVPIVAILPNNVVETNPFTNMFMVVISLLIAAIMLGLTVYMLIKIPSTIVKTSKRVIFETAEKAAPLVLQVQHKKDTKKNKIKLTPRLALAFKLILTLVPLILMFLSQFVEDRLISFDIAMFIGFCLAIISLCTFALQYICGRLLKVGLRDLI